MADDALEYVIEVHEAKWARVSTPDYPITVKDAKHANYGASEKMLKVLIGDSGDPLFARFWVEHVDTDGEWPREENNAERSPYVRIIAALVVKSAVDLQRQMARAAATMRQVYLKDDDWSHPEYTGTNTWGLDTRQSPGMPVRFAYADTPGIGIAWGAFDIGYREVI